MRIRTLVGIFCLLVLWFPSCAQQSKNCATTYDKARRPVQVSCFGAAGRVLSQTYVDTAGRELALPLSPSQPAKFGQRPEELEAYLHLAGPWPGNVDISGKVLFLVLIAESGYVQDVRLLSDMDAIWPGCTPAARRHVQTMPRWQPATVNGKPVPSLQAVSVRFGW